MVSPLLAGSPTIEAAVASPLEVATGCSSETSGSDRLGTAGWR
jgi:hypothetical protein